MDSKQLMSEDKKTAESVFAKTYLSSRRSSNNRNLSTSRANIRKELLPPLKKDPNRNLKTV